MPRTLLLADANATIHRVVALTFAGEDIRVVSVSDGEQAIARIATEPPDIVLADIALPKRNGYEVAAFVKGQQGLAHLPVLLLAGALEPVDEARAAQVHCDGVLVKPFEPHHMIARVRELISGRKGQPASGGVAPAPSVPLPPAPALPALERRDEPSLKLVRPAAAPSIPPPPARAAAPAPVRPTPAQAAPPAPVKPAPLPSEMDDDPLADYFDQLDAAFDSLEAAHPSRSKPQLSDDETDTMVVPTFNNVLGDLSREERRPANAGSEEILFGAPPVDPPDIRPVPNLSPAREPRVRAVAPSERRQAQEPPAAPPPQPPAPEPPPSPVAAQPRAPEPLWHEPAAATDGRHGAIADAFEALLAVEEEQRMANQPRPESQPVVITDELIDAVADRVMARLAPSGFTDLISRIATEVAERLVREEIDRIRGRK